MALTTAMRVNAKCQMPNAKRQLTCALLLCIGHLAFSIDRVSAQELPVLTAPVNDFANVIDEASEREMDRRIRRLQAATGDTVVVATVRTFQPYADIDELAVKMFENGGRGIGERGKDNGALILVAVDDRRARIEAGYDLEQFVTDGFAGETIRVAMGPRFAAGDYGGGLLAGLTRVINRVAERRGVTLEDVPRNTPPQGRDAEFPIGLIFLLIILAMSFIGRMGGGRRRRRRGGPWIVGGPWSGWNSGVGPFGGGGFGGGFGGGGGGFGGFGGGRSGGGGASGSW
jgi:uncharacterized protein